MPRALAALRIQVGLGERERSADPASRRHRIAGGGTLGGGCFAPTRVAGIKFYEQLAGANA
jgi:hypothetical protein